MVRQRWFRTRWRALTAIGAFIATGLVLNAVWPHDMTAVVQDVDADGVIAVELEGRTEHLRLAFVDLAGSEEQCLGEEGVDALGRLLPAGTTVTLVHGTAHETDGSYVTGLLVDDVLVDAQLAGTGLAALADAPGRPELTKEVWAAHSQASVSELGYFDPTVPCTPAARVAS